MTARREMSRAEQDWRKEWALAASRAPFRREEIELRSDDSVRNGHLDALGAWGVYRSPSAPSVYEVVHLGGCPSAAPSLVIRTRVKSRARIAVARLHQSEIPLVLAQAIVTTDDVFVAVGYPPKIVMGDTESGLEEARGCEGVRGWKQSWLDVASAAPFRAERVGPLDIEVEILGDWMVRECADCGRFQCMRSDGLQAHTENREAAKVAVVRLVQAEIPGLLADNINRRLDPFAPVAYPPRPAAEESVDA